MIKDNAMGTGVPDPAIGDAISHFRKLCCGEPLTGFIGASAWVLWSLELVAGTPSKPTLSQGAQERVEQGLSAEAIFAEAQKKPKPKPAIAA